MTRTERSGSPSELEYRSIFSDYVRPFVVTTTFHGSHGAAKKKRERENGRETIIGGRLFEQFPRIGRLWEKLVKVCDTSSQWSVVIVSEFLRTFHYRPFDSLAHTCERAALEKILSNPLVTHLFSFYIPIPGEREREERVGDGLGGGNWGGQLQPSCVARSRSCVSNSWSESRLSRLFGRNTRTIETPMMTLGASRDRSPL